MSDQSPTPETEPLHAGGSGNRWESPAAGQPAGQPAEAADDRPDAPPPPPDTGAYPVVAAPVARRRRARAAAAVAAAAVVAGISGAGGFAVGHATAADGGDGAQDGGRFGDHRFGDGDRPAPPGGGQQGGLPGQQGQQGQQDLPQAPDQGSGATS